MFKKSTLVLSTIGVLSLATVQAQLSSCDFAGNCTGYFYEDIKAAFVDCFDMNGVLLSRKENFYKTDLQKECASSTLAALELSLNGTGAMAVASVSANATISLCDYFEVGQGYQFSQADNGVGLVLLEDRVGGARDLYWKNMVNMPANLGWNWAELVQLIQSLENIKCSAANSTNVTIPSVPISSGVSEVLAALNLDWAQWLAQAQLNLNITTWGKAEWKYWIQSYVTYWNALQAYVAVGESAVSSIESIASSLTVGISGEVSSVINEIEQIVVSGAGLVLGEVNATVGVLNFTDFWSPAYDLENVTIGQILVDIRAASAVVDRVETWFTAFFINGGINAIFGVNTTYSIESGSITTNITTGSGSNVVELEVSQNVEAVIVWITQNFQSQIQALFPQFNFTFSTGATYIPPVVVIVYGTNGTVGNGTEGNGTVGNGTEGNGTIGNGTEGNGTVGNGTEGNSTNGTIPVGNGTNGTDGNQTLPGGSGSTPGNVSSSSYNWTASFYNVPSGCAYSDSTNSTIVCSSGNSRGCSFTFAELNEFWDFSATSSCSDAQNVLASCNSNTIITDLNTCLRLSYFNTFQLAQDTFIYGWLSYDSFARNALFGRCQAESNGFSLSQSNYEASFQFDFPNLI